MTISSHDHLTVFQSALFLTNAIVVDAPGFVMVVDPTWLPQEVEAVARHVASIRAGRPLYLLFTHSDFDHILGAGAFPDATTIASQAFIDNPNKDRKVSQILEWDSEYYIRRPYEIRYPEIGIPIVDDGQVVTLGETRMTFYHAPGHNADGLFTVIEPQGILITGDYLSDLEFPYIYHGSRDYESTLRKLDMSGFWFRDMARPQPTTTRCGGVSVCRSITFGRYASMLRQRINPRSTR